MRARRVRHEDWHLFGEANVDNGTMAEDCMFAVVANHVHGIHIPILSEDGLELIFMEAGGARDKKGRWRPGGTADDGSNAGLEGPGCVGGGGYDLEGSTVTDRVACKKSLYWPRAVITIVFTTPAGRLTVVGSQSGMVKKDVYLLSH